MKRGFGPLSGAPAGPTRRAAPAEPLWFEWLAFAGMRVFATWGGVLTPQEIGTILAFFHTIEK